VPVRLALRPGHGVQCHQLRIVRPVTSPIMTQCRGIAHQPGSIQTLQRSRCAAP